MTRSWRDRLEEAIEADPRSMRRISMDAGRGPSFVREILKTDKEPGIEKLISILDELGTVATLYVMSGIKVDDDVSEMIKLASSLDSEARVGALNFLSLLQNREGTATQ